MDTISDERLAELMHWIDGKFTDTDIDERARIAYGDVAAALGELMDRREATRE